MQEVEVAKDLIDYLVALGSLISAIAAIVALVLAAKSARDAESSARVAEGLLRLARQERKARLAEEAKGAELDFSLQLHAKPNEADGTSVCRLELLSRNTGELPADRAIVAVSIGNGGTVLRSDPAGNPMPTKSPTPQDHYELQWGEGRRQPITVWEELTIQVKTTRAANYYVVFPASPGIYECRANLYYEGIEWSIALTGTRDRSGTIGFKMSEVSTASLA